MAESDVDTSAYLEALIQASLTAAWMRRCGPTGKPGEWMIPGEFVDVVDLSDFEVTFYPTYAHLRDDGTVSGWSMHTRTNHHAWEWRVSVGWDDCTREEVEKLEDLGACFDDRECAFFILGSHDECPGLPENFIEALLIFKEGS